MKPRYEFMLRRIGLLIGAACFAVCCRCASHVAPKPTVEPPPNDPALIAAPSAPPGIDSNDGPLACALGSYKFPRGPIYTTQLGKASLSRSTKWAPGIPGGVPNRTTICKTLSPSGQTDDGAAINEAMKACPANQVVKLNPGTYRIGNAIYWRKSGVVLRGSGGPGASSQMQTRLVAEPTLFGPVVNIGPDLFPHPTGPSTPLKADAMQGANEATVQNNVGFSVGELVLVDMLLDDANDRGKWLLDAPAGGTALVYPYSAYNGEQAPKDSDARGWFTRKNRPVSQIMEIASIEGDKLVFTSSFHMTFDVAHRAEVTRFKYPAETSMPIENAGVEDLYVSGVPGSGGHAQTNNIIFNLAKYSWVRNVESDASNGDSIGLFASFRCVVRDSYMHSTINATPGGAGYGLDLSLGSADNLAENNISWDFNKIMVMRGAGGGNVIAYNYMDDGWISYQPNWVEAGLNAAHMATSHFELFEGNLSFALGSEDTWGNATFITWLRNVGTGHRSAWPPHNSYVFDPRAQHAGGCSATRPDDPACIPYADVAPRSAALVSFGHVFYNFVGNVLGDSEMPAAPQSQGFAYESHAPDWPIDPVPMWMIGYDVHSHETDRGVVNTTFRDGNYDFASKAIHWSADHVSLPKSLYLCAKPNFFGGYAWPWVDSTNASAPYLTHPFQYRAFSKTFGTYDNAGAMTKHVGFQLPAYVRFLQLRGIEAPPAACAQSNTIDAPPECRLLLTGIAP